MLLSRDDFREQVFKRDNYNCVICGKTAIDAHHIIDRRLFSDGGYYINNGASLCADCHIKAEMTTLTCDEIRNAAKIIKLVLPEHFYSDLNYDKWGNIYQPNNTRLRGELFYDKSVQKILKQGGVFDEFVQYIKYPRTYHLPWSKQVSKDDRILNDLSNFEGKEVVITEKMDGENTTWYNDYHHARSINSGRHETRTHNITEWAEKGYNIPIGWRICGENLYAVHSIKYNNLKSLFQVFSIWDDTNVCLSWDDTIEYAKMLELTVVPELYRGIWDENIIRDIKINTDVSEGYVVRLADSFRYQDFRYSVAKFVRENHVRTHGFWYKGNYEKNKLGE